MSASNFAPPNPESCLARVLCAGVLTTPLVGHADRTIGRNQETNTGVLICDSLKWAAQSIVSGPPQQGWSSSAWISHPFRLQLEGHLTIGLALAWYCAATAPHPHADHRCQRDGCQCWPARGVH